MRLYEEIGVCTREILGKRVVKVVVISEAEPDLIVGVDEVVPPRRQWTMRSSSTTQCSFTRCSTDSFLSITVSGRLPGSHFAGSPSQAAGISLSRTLSRRFRPMIIGELRKEALGAG